MRQFIESLLAFQLITGRCSPVFKIKNKLVRVAVFAAFFICIFAY